MHASAQNHGVPRIGIISIIFVYILVCLSSCSEQLSSYSMDYSTQKNDERVPTIPPGSPEHFVFIEKEVYPSKDYYMPSESLKIKTIVKFIKYKEGSWLLNDFEAYEVIDEGLEFQKGSLRCNLFDNPLNSSLARYSSTEMNNGFHIVVPGAIYSNQTVEYEYNIMVKKNGVFNTKTVAISGKNVGFYPDTEKTLMIHVSSYDFLSPYMEYLKGLISVLAILSGLFIAYRGIVEKPRERYHLKDVFSDIIDEYKILLKSLPHRYVLAIGSILVSLEMYSLISLRDPVNFPPINLMITNFLKKTSEIGIGPVILLLIAIFFLLYYNTTFNKLMKRRYHSICDYSNEMLICTSELISYKNIRKFVSKILGVPEMIWIWFCNIPAWLSCFLFMVVFPSSPLLVFLFQYIF